MLRDSNHCNTFQPGLLTRKHSAWEQRKLGEVAKITRGERFTAEDYVENGGIPCIHYGEIYTSYGPVATETFSHVREEMKSELRFAEPGDVIVATTSENVEDVCKAVAWMGKDQVAYHDDSFALSHREDPLFLTSFFETDGFYAQKASAAHGVKVMRVSSDALAKVDLPVPSLPEQRAIGTLFAHLDSLITLHQREAEPPGTHANMFGVHQHGRPRYPKGRPWNLARAQPACSTTITHSGSKCTRTGQFATSP